MCGIAGIWSQAPLQLSQLNSISTAFLHSLRKRGPNDSGSYITQNSSLLLCHTRLSILDLSSLGHQPKQSTSGRYSITFNGEIYNHQFLRSLCEKHINFRGSSDTETILALLDYFGFQDTINLLEGMFALVVWDSACETLYLSRDRFGEKPLYWGLSSLFGYQTLLFSSDLDAIFSYKSFSLTDLDHDSLHHYFTYGFIPNHKSIHRSFSQVTPGSYLTFTKDSFLAGPTTTCYWSPLNQLSIERQHFTSSYTHAVNHLDTLLTNSVSSKLISDVPLGCFLSGGIDSSLIASIYGSISNEPITTINLSFPDHQDKYFDEGDYASSVGSYLGSNHHQLELSSSSFVSNISRVLSSYSEPFSDLSQLPTFLISEFASQLGLKVVLSGDGGDELFGGYNRHIFAHYFQKSGLHKQPTLASGLARILKGLKTSSLDLSQNTLAKLVSALQSDSSSLNIYDSLLKRIDASKLLNSSIAGFTEPVATIPIPFADDNLDSDLSDLADSFRLLDTQFYLPSDILVKVDRASMSNSLEIRSPFLDTNLFNYAWSLPSNFLFSSNLVSFSGKRILRTLLSRYLPKNITGRPKHGFSIPMSNWLRGPLKNWAAELLHPTEINRLGLLDSSYVSRLWDEHLCGAYDHSNVLWSIIVWQDWSNRYIK